MKKTPTTLMILDGWGCSDNTAGNAVRIAQTPRFQQFLQKYPHTTLAAAGQDVGLPPDAPGNGETGHANLNGGRIVPQDLTRINGSIRDGSFFRNPAWLRAMENCRTHGSALHLAGLLSDGGIHSHIDHLFALLRMAKEQGMERVFLHLFLDGRDVPPASGLGFLERTEAYCRELGIGRIATVSGRFYAMDRNGCWDRIEQVYDAMVYGEPAAADMTPPEAVREAAARGITDEFLEPAAFGPDGTLSDHDSVIFFNFRGDRTRELARSLADPAFSGFTRQFFPLTIACATEYDAALPNVSAAFPKPELRNSLGACLSGLGLRQIRIAQRPEFAPAFLGGASVPLPGEDWLLVPEGKAPLRETLQPEMYAEDVARAAVERIESGEYDMVLVDIANCDRMGHSGVLNAAIAAVETVDACAGRIADATLKMGGIVCITSTHGNVERMLAADGSPTPANTANPVPFLLCGAGTRLRPGRLADVAPTLLDVLGLDCPPEMDGKTLIVE